MTADDKQWTCRKNRGHSGKELADSSSGAPQQCAYPTPRARIVRLPHAVNEREPSVNPRPQTETEPLIEPWLKDFLDTAVIPALLREFAKTVLATRSCVAAESLEATPKGGP